MMVDTLLIGSGVAATSIAQRLLQRDPNASILILEAGERVKTKDYGLWEHYLITGQLPYDKYKDLNYPQKDKPGENMSVGGTEIPLAGARVLTYGGSTIHWGGWSFRLKPEDFHLFSNTGNGADWPFDYGELEPYYCQAEEYIGVSGDSTEKDVPRSRGFPFPAFPYTLEDKPLADALQSLGVSYSHLPIARHGVTDTRSKHAPCQTTGTCKYCPFGARYAATNFLNDMVAWNDYPNLTIRTGVVVDEILMDSKQRASGVAVTLNGTSDVERIDARQIIVTAGTIETAKLLQRSISTSWPQGIGNDHDLVGRHFITHPYFIFTGTIPENPLKLQPEMNFPTLCTRHYDSPAEQAAGKFLLVNPADTVQPNLVMQMRAGKTRDEIEASFTRESTIMVHGMIEVFGRPQNKITNTPKRNRMGLLETSVDYTKDASFDARMAEIQERVDIIYTSMGANVVNKPSISWRADHAASTCRMGTDESNSVVDANLRVHAVDNLFICSNATLPSIGAINPTLTLTALALRLGDHLPLAPA